MDRFRADQARFKKAGLDKGAAKGEAASASRYAGLAKAYGKNKGGLASKPKPNPKKKRTTKGLGTKPKAT